GPSTSSSHAPAQASRPSVSAPAPDRAARSPTERNTSRSRSATSPRTSASRTPLTYPSPIRTASAGNAAPAGGDGSDLGPGPVSVLARGDAGDRTRGRTATGSTVHSTRLNSTQGGSTSIPRRCASWTNVSDG